MADDLRERVYARISQARNDAYMDCRGMVPFRAAMMAAVDDLIALFAERDREAATGGYAVGAKHAAERCAERERELRARIEALPKWSGNAGKVLLERGDVLALFDEAVSDGE